MIRRSTRLFSPGLLGPLILIMGVFFMLTSLQRQLIYFPTQARAEDLAGEAARYRLEAWRDGHGTTIGWRQLGDSDAPRRMLVFHGNAGYALHRAYFVAGLNNLGARWSVFLFEYPGYGARDGTPSEDLFQRTATQALQSLLAEDSRPVYLLGESLGSGIASYLAAAFPQQVAGLLLVTPFSSLADVAAHHYPILPIRTVLSERYDSEKALSGYQGPVAFLLAGSDEVVPTRFGRQPYDSYAGPKWLRIEPGAGHNTLPYNPDAPWWKDATDFLTREN